jgi:lysophospholipid acyltransferase (LPLAT)-like uncharacterized protein
VSERKPIRRFLLTRLLPPFGAWLYRWYSRSWRYEVEGAEHLATLAAEGRPAVCALLHQRSIQTMRWFSQPGRGRWMLMCSQSRDGEFTSRIQESLGFRVARGSSGRGGLLALLEMIKWQREDRALNAGLAIDGSRGPRGVAQLGVLTLAQKADSRVVPIAVSTGDCWVWPKSWDRAVIPKRRARIRVRIGAPISVPPRISEQAMEALRQRLEQTIYDMHVALDRETGFTDSQPIRLPPASPSPSLPASTAD